MQFSIRADWQQCKGGRARAAAPAAFTPQIDLPCRFDRLGDHQALGAIRTTLAELREPNDRFEPLPSALRTALIDPKEPVAAFELTDSSPQQADAR
jgi:hypothetical protein